MTVRTIEWDIEKRAVRMIDQRKLPGSLEFHYCTSSAEVTEAIRNMTIRGAPAIGVAGGFGLAVEAFRLAGISRGNLRELLHESASVLRNARPTAVNLTWGINRILRKVDDLEIGESDLPDRILFEAQAMAEEDISTNLRLAELGSSLIDDGDTIIHHCNTGSLAVVDWGTALGAIRYAHEHGKRVHMLVDETRPRLQGARLTAWECQQYGIPFEIITDNSAGYFLNRGQVQKVFFGADRVAANGDVVNKVGTYMLSLAAHANHVPVICVFPLTTLDLSIPHGGLIPIEDRDEQEVLGIQYQGEPAAPKGAKARNPAFDITPNELITALVTEAGVIKPPFTENLANLRYNNRLEN